MDNGEGSRFRSVVLMGLLAMITAAAGAYLAASVVGDRKSRRRPIVRGLHVGPGIFDDFKFLLEYDHRNFTYISFNWKLI